MKWSSCRRRTVGRDRPPRRRAAWSAGPGGGQPVAGHGRPAGRGQCPGSPPARHSADRPAGSDEARGGLGMTREPFDIIIRPLLTEKLTDMRESQRKIGLLVRADANKVEIRKATERALNVKVEKVSVMNVGGKIRRIGRMAGKKPDWKKAIVTLKPGEKLEIFEGV